MAKRPTSSNLGIDSRSYPIEIIEMMESATHCLCCNKLLRYIDKDKDRNRGYCSMECYCKLPPKLAYACKEYGMKPKELLCSLLNKHTDIATAGLMGIGKNTLYRYMKLYKVKKKVTYY